MKEKDLLRLPVVNGDMKWHKLKLFLYLIKDMKQLEVTFYARSDT